MTKQTVKDVYADGAYQSPNNREFAQSHEGMNLKTGRMQGGSRFILNRKEETDELWVTDTKTGEVIQATYVGETQKHGKRWRIPLADVKQTYPYRYFTEKEVNSSKVRQEIESLPIEEQNKRDNIEAAMFQYSFHTRNNKTRYRGLLKHRLQAYSRCLWMNLIRLMIFQISVCQRTIGALCNDIYLIRESVLSHIQSLFSQTKNNIFRFSA